MSYSSGRRGPTALPALPVVLLLLLFAAPLAAAPRDGEHRRETLAEAQELLDADRPDEAAERLEALLEKRPDDAEALLLASTAHFMLGEREAGRAALERSLALDPAERQGWLNLGALRLAESDFEGALGAFRRAEALAPEAVDNHLNIGAVLLLSGELGEATRRFASYLERVGESAEAYYLVATNYALGGYEALAVEHLKRAVELDDRFRRDARVDPSFADLADNPRFRDVLDRDTFRPQPGDYTASRTFGVGWEPGGGPLLDAVIRTLQLSGYAFDPQVEVATDWALVRGDLRIKVAEEASGRGLVQVSAPARHFTPAEWQRRTETLFAGIRTWLAAREE